MAAAVFASLTTATLIRRLGLHGTSSRSSSRAAVAAVRTAHHSTSAAAAAAAPAPSVRIGRTDTSIIGVIGDLMRAQPQPVMSLAQGVVHWAPPQSAVAAATDALASGDATVHAYGPANGDLELQAALRAKLASENGISASEVMVTAGANQAFTNVVIALADAGDRTVLFRPYYFNHLMALQMTGGADTVRQASACSVRVQTLHNRL